MATDTRADSNNATGIGSGVRISGRPPRVDVVLLSYNHADWVAPCLRALADCGYERGAIQVFAVDNASADATEAAYLDAKSLHGAEKPPLAIQVVQTGANLGFAGGCNVGWRLGTAPYVLFLNLDTQARPGFLDALVDALERRPTAAFAGAKLHFPNPGGVCAGGHPRLQHAGGRVYFNGMTDHYFNAEIDAGQADLEREVAFCTGACLLARRSALEALGGFDEDFHPAYCEEVDLCLRARQFRWPTIYVPTAEVEHHESAGLGGRRDPRFLQAIYRSRIKLAAKHATPSDFFERWLPTERWWFGIVESAEARPYQRRSYWQGFRFLLTRNLKALFHLRPLPELGVPTFPQHQQGAGELPSGPL